MGIEIMAPEKIDIAGADLVFIASTRADIIDSLTQKINKMWPGLRVESIRSCFFSDVTRNTLWEYHIWTDEHSNTFESLGGNLINRIDISIIGHNNKVLLE